MTPQQREAIRIHYGCVYINPEWHGGKLISEQAKPSGFQLPDDWLMPVLGLLVILAGNPYGGALIGVWLAARCFK